MKMEPFFSKEKILNSQEAESGAKNLIHKLNSRHLEMDIMPNTYPRFTGELEEEDYISYCRFLESYNGKQILSILEEENATEYIEL